MKKFFILLVIILASVSGVVLVYFGSLPVSTDSTLQDFVINQGDGVRSISRRLQANGYIRHQYVFILHAYLAGLHTRLQAGTFQLSPSLSTTQVVAKLSSAGKSDYWLKIIEGQRLAELPIRFDSSLEGYLFPDSYLIPDHYSLEETASLIQKNFTQKFNQAKSGTSITQLSDTDAVILASLVEREARSLTSKQYVAGILQNRLQIGMPLQVDASVQYVRDSRASTKDYWRPIAKADLSLSSPYNTYLNPGLPPGPICNPGYNSLYAVFHPLASDYLYYITGNDNQMHYAKTLDEHNANIAKYLR